MAPLLNPAVYPRASAASFARSRLFPPTHLLPIPTQSLHYPSRHQSRSPQVHQWCALPPPHGIPPSSAKAEASIGVPMSARGVPSEASIGVPMSAKGVSSEASPGSEISVGANSVAVIGGGVSGLIAAKSLLQAGMSPVLFEKGNSLGGMWGRAPPPPPQQKQQQQNVLTEQDPPTDSAGAPPVCWGSMRTNLSRFTCAFSDFPWEPSAPLFPSAPEMNQYLQSYSRKFLGSNLGGRVRFGTQVLEVSSTGDGKWKLIFSTSGGATEELIFPYIIIASGFFQRPLIPRNIKGLSAFNGILIHSSAYSSPDPFAKKRVAVIGASFSGVDIAADVAGKAAEVHHIVTKGFYPFPRLVPSDPLSPSSPLLPIDLALYRRCTQTSSQETTVPNEEQRRAAHEHFRRVSGDPADLDRQLAMDESEFVRVAVSDDYALHVQAGSIRVHRGRLVEIEEGQEGEEEGQEGKEKVQEGEEKGREGEEKGRGVIVLDSGRRVKGIDAVILCTGMGPWLPFLSEGTKREMSYDPNDASQPLLLHRTMFHPSMPNAAFVGMVKGPYFLQMELQARLAAAVFSGERGAPSAADMEAGIEEERRIRAQQPRPQMPHGDYINFSNSLAAEIGMTLPSDDTWRKENDIVIPAQYCDPHLPDAVAAAGKTKEDLEHVCAEFATGRGIPAAVFRGLVGSWKLTRQLKSQGKGIPSGLVEGTATFTPRPWAKEHLYREDGYFVSQSGIRNKVWKEYIYTCDGPEADMSAYFAEKSQRTYLFHKLRFFKPPASDDRKLTDAEIAVGDGWYADGDDHLCGDDNYEMSYRFALEGPRVAKFCVIYRVTGPYKDYTSSTLFERL